MDRDTVKYTNIIFDIILLVVIVDPGMKVEKDYSPYEDGIKMDIFIKVSNLIKMVIHFILE